MHIRRVQWAVVVVLLIWGGTIAIWNELYGIWRSHYTTMFVPKDTRNLVVFGATSLGEDLVRFFTGDSGQGLPVVRLYVPKKAQAHLMENLPNNIKNWQRGYLVYPDGKLRKVKVRHRGDNPLNWAHDKKSWRVKTTKKRQIDNVRVINYIVPRNSQYLTFLLDYEIHRRMGMPTPDARLVELLLNDSSNGVYLELEQLDENFLRRRNIMPVNIYKGEQDNSERQLMIEPFLFDNPGLWTKITTFNQRPENDFDDLRHFLMLVKEASISDSAFEQLIRLAPLEDWARFSAFQTFVQSWHNDSIHNMRLVSDPWKGTIFPVIHDTSAFFGNDGKITIDMATNALQAIYNGSSRFLLAKHRILKKFVDEKLLLLSAEQARQQLPQLKISQGRERHLHMISGSVADSVFGIKFAAGKSANERLIGKMLIHHQALQKAVEAPPNVAWSREGAMIKLVVSGFMPAGRVFLSFHGNAPGMLAWDADGNGRLSKGDTVLPVRRVDGGLVIDAVWYANRFADGRIQPTAFNIVGDSLPDIRRMAASNPFTNQSVEARNETHPGATPMKFNVPVIDRADPAPVVLDDRITITGLRVFHAPVVIRAGTVIEMAPDASLVFRNRLTVAGEAGRPVVVRPVDADKPWGTFAIFGRRAAGSRISHLHMEGGSGATAEGVHYTGMLSVHDSQNVEFDSIFLRANKVFDDTIHIIYCKNVRLRNSRIEDAFSDGLDVDISEVAISGTTITGAGNDAIDLMSSRVVIDRSRLTGAGDKGVSVGEASTALIVNSYLGDNKIGVESKDNSQAYVVGSDLIGNQTQLNAYGKNWRYGGGGRADVDKVFMQGARNLIAADKRSRIRIDDSSISPRPVTEGGTITISEDSGLASGRTAVRQRHTDAIGNILSAFGVSQDPAVRGARP